MQFTMGTLTALFTLALLGASFALMFSDYENSVLDGKFPFDVQIYSKNTDDDFAEEKRVIEEAVTVSSFYPYHIYTDEENTVNKVHHLLCARQPSEHLPEQKNKKD